MRICAYLLTILISVSSFCMFLRSKPLCGLLFALLSSRVRFWKRICFASSSLLYTALCWFLLSPLVACSRNRFWFGIIRPVRMILRCWSFLVSPLGKFRDGAALSAMIRKASTIQQIPLLHMTDFFCSGSAWAALVWSRGTASSFAVFAWTHIAYDMASECRFENVSFCSVVLRISRPFIF